VNASDNSLVGQLLLGRYRVLRPLALGGMGAVYVARTEGARGFSKKVVIKRILPVWRSDEEIVSLFAREARILSQLQDPGIVSVLDFGQIEDGTLVMVLDYVQGYQLAHWQSYLRATSGPMPVEMAVHIVLRVLSALHYAHTFVRSDGRPLAVIHRDVSPSNILLDVSGHVKLVDFGIARADGDAEVYKTEAPQLRGKFGYLAPELFTGEPPSPQTDVYSAGVVLYELLTGDNPFRGRELADSYHKALNVAAPAVSSLRSDVSERLSDVIVQTALAKDPAQRYASAAEFAEALRPERAAPDETCQAQLRSAVQAAFAGPLPELLGLPPLTSLDESSRDPGPLPSDRAAAATARIAIPSAGDAPPTSTVMPLHVVASADAPAAQLAPSPALEISHARATAQALAGSAPRKTNSFSLRWVAVACLLLLSSVPVAGILHWLDRRDDRVIVIEREAHAPAEAGPNSKIPGRDAIAVEPAAKARVSAAVEPEPELLTSTFAREQGRIQDCFAAHAPGDASPPLFTLSFRVMASGEVEQAALKPGHVASSPLGLCLLQLAKSTRFPLLTHAVTFQIPIRARVEP